LHISRLMRDLRTQFRPSYCLSLRVMSVRLLESGKSILFQLFMPNVVHNARLPKTLGHRGARLRSNAAVGRESYFVPRGDLARRSLERRLAPSASADIWPCTAVGSSSASRSRLRCSDDDRHWQAPAPRCRFQEGCSAWRAAGVRGLSGREWRCRRRSKGRWRWRAVPRIGRAWHRPIRASWSG
jgi:hypothetical protein